MHDLLGTYERLREVYQLYIESAFPFRHELLNDERRRLLSEGNLLSQPPLIEPVPTYELSGLKLDDACSKIGEEYKGLETICRSLFNGHQLYKHQWESLDRSLLNGRDIVVTTGTGSGKTECFLLPVLAEIVKESRNWPPSSPPPDDRKWWRRERSQWIGQWQHTGRHENHQHAVRAMILYPLNALIEDQMKRLRATLDSEETHAWLDEHRGGNRILFGRYTGQTPVSGKRIIGGRQNASAKGRLKKDLARIEKEYMKVLNASRVIPELKYHFPNQDGGEMWSRWDMQQTPPDILITNYSMLNIMLMREIESTIFERTKEWLGNSKDHHFTLVIDELHSYRGTSGTEVAYILRLMLDRLGLEPSSSQLKIIATSASLDKESGEFLAHFFGRPLESFDVISGDIKYFPPACARNPMSPMNSS